MYLIFKHLHMTLALLSIIGFMVRGQLAFRQHPLLDKKWLRISPHIVDTLLLSAAIYLAYSLRLWPWEAAWLCAKVIALILYILLGTLGIKRKGSLKQQKITYAAAILVFLYIAAVAISKSAWPF